jgi:hypothetical protein
MIKLAQPILGYTYDTSFVTETKYCYGEHKSSE